MLSQVHCIKKVMVNKEAQGMMEVATKEAMVAKPEWLKCMALPRPITSVVSKT